MKIIIHKNKDITVSVLIPTHQGLMIASNNPQYADIERVEVIEIIEVEAYNDLVNIGINIIAEKDVPKGLPYKIVDKLEIPSDRTNRDLWEWDDSIVPAGYGGESNEFDSELLAKYNEEKNV